MRYAITFLIIGTIVFHNMANAQVAVKPMSADALAPDYFWFLGEPVCVESGVWTRLPIAQVVQNYTPAQFDLENGVITFPLSQHGYFGEMSATVAWDDTNAPAINFRRAVRIQQGHNLAQMYTAAQDTALHVPNEGEPLQGNDGLFYQTAYLQPGVAPDTTGKMTIDIWQNSGTVQCLSVPKGDDYMAAPLIMYTNTSRFQ